MRQKRHRVEKQPPAQTGAQHGPGNRQANQQRERRHGKHEDESITRPLQQQLPRQAIKIIERHLTERRP